MWVGIYVKMRELLIVTVEKIIFNYLVKCVGFILTFDPFLDDDKNMIL